MSAAQDKLSAQAASLRRKIGEAEATLGDLRARLARVESQLTGAPVPVTGLELLWKAALPKARERSSKHKCRTEWNRIPKGERPLVSEALDALKAWNRCEEWKKDGNQFAPALDRFIKERRWESLPEGITRDGLARYRPTASSATIHPPGEQVTDAAEIAKLLSIRPPRMNS